MNPYKCLLGIFFFLATLAGEISQTISGGEFFWSPFKHMEMPRPKEANFLVPMRLAVGPLALTNVATSRCLDWSASEAAVAMTKV